MKKVLLALPLLVALGCSTSRPASTSTSTPPSEAACTGVADAARNTPLLGDPQSIVAVRTLVHPIKSENHKVAFTRVIGAEVVLRAESGVTAEHLERIARCQLANRPSDGPLSVSSAEVQVVSTDEGFAMQITSADPSDAKEIVARAERARARATPSPN